MPPDGEAGLIDEPLFRMVDVDQPIEVTDFTTTDRKLHFCPC
jgi:hypothetical protein